MDATELRDRARLLQFRSNRFDSLVSFGVLALRNAVFRGEVTKTSAETEFEVRVLQSDRQALSVIIVCKAKTCETKRRSSLKNGLNVSETRCRIGIQSSPRMFKCGNQCRTSADVERDDLFVEESHDCTSR